ncbi:hypothetical protein [Amycolatopsis sp. NPDC059657]|uniref:hypothetical protein n=1 Tax=Amycolatopsis sp. NPDC059657 TaxID=3346899 RepID=UPI00366F1DF7
MNDEQLRAMLVGAVAAARRGADQEAVLLCDCLTTGSEQLAREGIRQLAVANVEMLRSLVELPSDGMPLFVIDGEDVDGGRISIDEFEPAQRAATRVMLAYAHDRPADADLQLDVVASVPGPAEMRLVFVHVLCWTLELLDICGERNQPIPGWLRAVAA